MSCEGGACTCGCSGSHMDGCPQYAAMQGTLAGLLEGDACGATPANNGAVFDISCSLGVAITGFVDRVNRFKAELGFVPYRVFLVWEQRVDSEEYTEVRRVELMPAAIAGLNEVKLVLGPDGRAPDGAIMLTGISPNQASQDDLLGRLEGRAWDRDGERFFYETTLHPRCAGLAVPTPWRWTPDGIPELRASKAPLGYMIRLTDQRVARGRHGEDRTTAIGEQPEQNRWDQLRR